MNIVKYVYITINCLNYFVKFYTDILSKYIENKRLYMELGARWSKVNKSCIKYVLVC